MKGSDFLKKHKNELLIAVGLISALLFLLMSGGRGENDEYAESTDIQEYENKLESRLESLISDIEGIGYAKVMVSMECGLEYVYAKNTETTDTSLKEEYFKDSDKNALIVKEITPRVRGVAVICTGGDKALIQNKITELVSSLLGIKSTQIFVGS